MKAFGRRSACAPNEFGLQGPSADGRPAPTEKAFFASAEADARRAAPWKADFNRRKSLRPAVGLCAE
jgi:transcriptional regulator of nitric oxide reductase